MMFSMPMRDQTVIGTDRFTDSGESQNQAAAPVPQKEEKMERDDYLLKQIDEFREKAKQLQELMATKETKARELQRVVDEQESKASELKYFVAEKEKEAEELNAGITRNVNAIMDHVDGKLDRKFDDLDHRMDEKLEGQLEKTAEGTEEIKRTLSEFKIPEFDTDAITTELKKPISEMQEEVGGMRTEILEKIHTEGVQVFRNTRDLIDEQSQKAEVFDEMKKEMRSLRMNLKIALWFGIVNFVLLGVFVLYSLGVFHF